MIKHAFINAALIGALVGCGSLASGQSLRDRSDDSFAIPKRTPRTKASPTPAAKKPDEKPADQNAKKAPDAKAGTPAAGQPPQAPGAPAPPKPDTNAKTIKRAVPGAKPPAAAKAAPAGAPASTGQVKEVTRGFVESIKTRKVDYDETEMAENPGVLILNSRKYKPEPSRVESERSRQGNSSIVRPL